LEAARAIVRLHKPKDGKDGYLEFLLGSQEQSGHSTGAYFSKKSPAEVAAQQQPISRYLGTKAFESGECYVFELEVDDNWATGAKTDEKVAHLSPIPGERGTRGIAVCLNKAAGYEDPVGDSDEKLTKNGCIAISTDCLKGTWKMDAGAGKDKIRHRLPYNPQAGKKYIWQ
jgi:hypothetical protein